VLLVALPGLLLLSSRISALSTAPIEENQQPGTYIASYDWDFGDGSTDQTGAPQDYHYYSYYGTYQVTLIVVAGTGQQSSPYQLEVTI
jgi:PKD repeat protein